MWSHCNTWPTSDGRHRLRFALSLTLSRIRGDSSVNGDRPYWGTRMKPIQINSLALLGVLAFANPVLAAGESLDLDLSGFYDDVSVDSSVFKSDNLDEKTGFFKRFGQRDGLGGKMTIFSPETLRAGAVSGGQLDLSGIDLVNTMASVNGGFGDVSQTLAYVTPRIAGVQGGISFGSQDELDGSLSSVCRSVLCARSDDNITQPVELGLTYFNQFGERFRLGGKVTFLQTEGQQSDVFVVDQSEAWTAGLNIGYSGFTLGGSYKESQNFRGDGIGYTALDVGATYETGPWGFMVSYGVDEYEGTGGTVLESNAVQGGVDFTLESGVSFGGGVQYIEAEFPGVQAEDEDATVVFIETMVAF